MIKKKMTTFLIFDKFIYKISAACQEYGKLI